VAQPMIAPRFIEHLLDAGEACIARIVRENKLKA